MTDIIERLKTKIVEYIELKLDTLSEIDPNTMFGWIRIIKELEKKET